MWSFCLQQRRKGNSRFPLPNLECIVGQTARISNVKEEDPVTNDDMLQIFSVPEHFYSVDIGKKVGSIPRPMSTEKGWRCNCVVFKANYQCSATFFY